MKPLLSDPNFCPIDLSDQLDTMNQLLNLPFGNPQAAISLAFEKMQEAFEEQSSAPPSQQLELAMRELQKILPKLQEAFGMNLTPSTPYNP